MHVDLAYKELMEKILNEGELKGDRTGTGTISTFGNQVEIDLTKGFPLLTTKKVYWKGIVAETVMFLKGITDLKFLLDLNVDIWTRDAWMFYLKNKQYRDNEFYGAEDMTLDEFREYAKSNGFDMGEIYGFNWVNFNGDGVNQLQDAIDELKVNPHSRRMKIYSANPSKKDKQTLPPCHDSFQFYSIKKYIDILFTMRSSDGFHGFPFNIASYALIVHIVGEMIGLTPRKLVAQLGDSHLYLTHLDAIKEQLKREPFPLPKLKLSDRVRTLTDISDIEIEDIELVGYQSHPSIKAPQAF